MKKFYFITTIFLFSFISFTSQKINDLIPIEALSNNDKSIVENIINDIAVSMEYKNNTFKCNQNTLDLMLDNLPLASSIWRAYNFAPPYVIELINYNEFYINDGVRLEGRMKLIYQNFSKRIYTAHCTVKFDKTIIKAVIKGDAVVILENYNLGNGTGNNVYVFIKLDNIFWKYLSKISFAIFEGFVDNRINNLLKDAKIIAQDVQMNPNKVLYLLKKKNEAFDELLVFENIFINKIK